MLFLTIPTSVAEPEPAISHPHKAISHPQLGYIKNRIEENRIEFIYFPSPIQRANDNFT
jgi:hypothetical protein